MYDKNYPAFSDYITSSQYSYSIMHAEAAEANKIWGAARLLKLMRFPIDCSIRVLTVILEYSEHIILYWLIFGGVLPLPFLSCMGSSSPTLPPLSYTVLADTLPIILANMHARS